MTVNSSHGAYRNAEELNVLTEYVSDRKWVFRIDNLVQDSVYALRRLYRNPSLSLGVVVSIGLGVGAATAVFSAINGILISPYPYKRANQMVMLSQSSGNRPPNPIFVTMRELRVLLSAASIDGGMMWDDFPMSRTDAGLPESVAAGKLSINAFEFLGVPPLLGRTFGGHLDIAIEPEKSAVLSYNYWRSHYGGSPNAIGQFIQLDRQRYTIIGVMPERFRLLNSDLYVPLAITPTLGPPILRVREDVSLEAARAELESIVQRDVEEQSGSAANAKSIRIGIKTLYESGVGHISGVLGVLSGAVALLVAVGCANVSILLISRGVGRRTEFATRAAVGASSVRIAHQLLVESAIISIAGGVFGTIVGYSALKLVVKAAPLGLIPTDIDMKLDTAALAFALVISVVCGLAAGLWPAVRLSRQNNLVTALRSDSINVAGSSKSHTLLALVQVAVTILLVAGAAAALQKYQQLTATTLGYDPRNVVVLPLTLSDGEFTNWAERTRYYDALQARVGSLRGVDSVAVQLGASPPEVAARSAIEIPGKVVSATERVVPRMVSSEYFSTLRIPLQSGRIWSKAESARADGIAVINEAMARRYWPNESPVGQRIKLGFLVAGRNRFIVASPRNDPWVHIVGVVGDVRHSGLAEPMPLAVYVPYTLVTADAMTLLVRSRADESTIINAARQQIASLNPHQAVNKVSTLERLLWLAGWGRQQFVASLFSACAALALLLTAVGLYSVVSYSISRREREFGVRMALGAHRGRIAAAVLRSAAAIVVSGLCLGFTFIFALRRLIMSWTGSSIWDPSGLISAALVLLVAAAAGAMIPMTRVITMSPIKILRTEG